MAFANLFDAPLDIVVLTLGRRDDVEERISDSAACRQDDSEPRIGILFEDPRHPFHAHRIGDTRAAEFMNSPPIHC
jgi:hypothetical protein